jgi:2'-5' RNA ligase
MKNLHRTFIAIPLPAEARLTLRPFVQKIEAEMPANAFRFLDPESWHITLSFLGDQDDEGVGRVVSALPSVVPMIDVPAEVQFEKIIYSPNADDPSRIVVMGTPASSSALGEVRDILEDGLIAHEANFRPDNRRFSAHITVAHRLKESVLLPELEAQVDLVVYPESVDVYESIIEKGETLGRLGTPELAHYELLASTSVDGVL